MFHSSPLERIPELVDALVDGEDEAARDRGLLDAVFALGAAEAAALWKPIGAGEEESTPRWRAILERGPSDLLPRPPEVEAAVTDSLGFELPHGRVVLHAGTGSRRIALALGGFTEGDEGEKDALEALLALWCLLAPVSEEAGTHDSLDLLHSLLPAEIVPEEAGKDTPAEDLSLPSPAEEEENGNP